MKFQLALLSTVISAKNSFGVSCSSCTPKEVKGAVLAASWVGSATCARVLSRPGVLPNRKASAL
eukprot:7281351-Pyramimonas_sp.AAC.1